jgi:hypothetical protein
VVRVAAARAAGVRVEAVLVAAVKVVGVMAEAATAEVATAEVGLVVVATAEVGSVVVALVVALAAAREEVVLEALMAARPSLQYIQASTAHGQSCRTTPSLHRWRREVAQTTRLQ